VCQPHRWSNCSRYAVLAHQALHWEIAGFKRGPGRPRIYKLEEHKQQGLAKDGNHLGGSGGGSSKQIRMASKCGPIQSTHLDAG